ncbi:MAG: hypothetical protein ACP5P2_03855, partial [Candidatus Micrarchaeia archaeon]
VALRLLFLVTTVPLLISSLCLALVKYKGNANNGMAEKKGIKANAAALALKEDKAYKAVLVATALLGSASTA